MAESPVSTTFNDKEKDVSRSIDLTITYPDTLSEMSALYGNAVIESVFIQQVKVKFQAYIRGLLKQDRPEAEIIELAASWRPDVTTKRAKKSNFDKLMDATEEMNPEQERQLLERLKTMQKAKKAG